MIGQLARKIFGSANDRYVKRQYKIVNQINAFEPSISALSDEELKNKTVEFRKRIADGETLDELLPEAFAVVREAAKRTLGQRHYDVQLIGGIVLHHGQIAEMKTGEGKTLVATLAAYLNALPGKGVQHRYRQRLSCQTRCRVDGAGLSFSGPYRRLHNSRKNRRRAPCGI